MSRPRTLPRHDGPGRPGQASGQIYWDQASVLVQVGAESAGKVLDPSLPPNELITG